MIAICDKCGIEVERTANRKGMSTVCFECKKKRASAYVKNKKLWKSKLKPKK